MDEINGGAYRLYIHMNRGAVVDIGALGRHRLAAGRYLYIGSAKRGLAQRVARHRRLANEKQGRCHWHIDRVLLHPQSRLTRVVRVIGGDECELARQTASRRGVAVPVPGFGATDCRSGCPAHLFRLPL